MSNTQLVPVGDLQTMAGALAKSGLFGVKTADQALALMLVAQAEGRHPGSVASDYHIIQGRASLKSDAMLARFQQAGGRVEWHDHTNESVSATFSHPQGGALRIDWDMARAKAAGLGTKDNWKSYPRQMLRARVISEGVRAVFPAVLNGMYAPEEVQEFQPQRVTVYDSRLEAANAELQALPAGNARWAGYKQPEVSIDTMPVRERLEDFRAAFTGKEAEVEAFLVARKQLSVGQSWTEAAEYLEERVAGRIGDFIEAVMRWNAQNKEALPVA
jgi:hypothetical protein